MKRFLALMLSIALIGTTAACGSGLVEPEELTQGMDRVVLSRADSEPIVPETEFPSPDDTSTWEGASSTPAESVAASAPPQSSQATAKPAPSSQATPASKAPSQAAPSQPPASSKAPAPSISEPEATQEPSSEPEASEPSEPEHEAVDSPSVSGEVRAMWFSYFELAPMIKGRSASQFKNSIGQAFENCRQMGLNTMIVQVRPHGDAFYSSQYFPWSHWLDPNGQEGNSPGYDPLKIMVDEAHGRGLKIEAWLNPYRVRSGNQPLSSDNPAKIWLDEGSDLAIRYNGGIYYNPARAEVQELIVNGVKEIVQNYAVDGIHFDDYFYPAPDNSFDQTAYDEYRSSGGSLSLGDWRRGNVDALVKSVYRAVKNAGKSLVFGISPQGNRGNNYNMQYINVDKWVSSGGYVDYICPQIYWGFNSSAAPFEKIANEWERVVAGSNVKLYIGLAAYKIGTQENDFSGCTDLMMRQVQTSRELNSYAGFVLFRYDSLFHPASGVKSNVNQELSNLEDILD